VLVDNAGDMKNRPLLFFSRLRDGRFRTGYAKGTFSWGGRCLDSFRPAFIALLFLLVRALWTGKNEVDIDHSWPLQDQRPLTLLLDCQN
jgi:hypothetical protein